MGREQVGDRHVERLCEVEQVADSEVALRALDVADHGSGEAGRIGQVFLCQTSCFPEFTEPRTERAPLLETNLCTSRLAHDAATLGSIDTIIDTE